MGSVDFITFYHVTFQGNLKNIKNLGGLITSGDHNNIGLGDTVGSQGYLEDLEGRVFATTEWLTVVKYINNIKERAEKVGNAGILKYLVVLKITIPLVDFNVLFLRKSSHNTTQNNSDDQSFPNGGPSSGSYYFTSNFEPSIGLQYLSIAVSRIYRLDTNSRGEYQFGKNWWWMPLTDFDFQEAIYPVIPDVPVPRTTTAVDINKIVHAVVMREMKS